MLRHLRLSPLLAIGTLVSATTSLSTTSFSEAQPSRSTGKAQSQQGSTQENDLFFLGSGIRRRRIVFVDVNVYNTTASATLPLWSAAQQWATTLPASRQTSLPVLLFQKLHQPPATTTAATAKAGATKGSSKKLPDAVAINLKFLRAVSTDNVVQAFDESLAGCDPVQFAQFKDFARAAIGAQGLAVDDVLEFVWCDGGGLLINARGVFRGCFFGSDIEQRLLETYLDPVRTIAPDLVSDVEKNLTSSSQA